MELRAKHGDLDALKVAIAGKDTASENARVGDLKISVTSEASATSLTPCFLHNKVKLTQMNAACQYLHELAGLVDDRQQLEQLLLWEAVHLRPRVLAVLYGLTQNKKLDDSDAIKTIVSLLKSKLTKQKTFLSYKKGQSISAVDVIIWSDLYPLFQTPEVDKILSAGFPDLKSWFTGLSERSSFKQGVESILGSNNPQTAWHPWIKSTFKAVAVTPIIAPEVACSKVVCSANKSPVKKPQNNQAQNSSNNLSSPDGEATLISALKEVQITDQELEAALKGWNDKNWQQKTSSAAPVTSSVVLPIVGERNVLVTSALPYVNNVPHLGNIVGAVLSADVFARFCRLRGYNTLFICGTDEYGTTTETKALEEGLTPKQICDKYNALHSEIYEWFDISFDKFGRTTTEKQTQVAQSIFWDLHQRNNLREDSMTQLYCTKCSRFLADRFVEGICPNKDCGYEDARGDQCDKCNKLINATELIKPRCKVCSNSPIVKESRHIFIDLPKIQPALEKWYDGASKVWTHNARVIARTWIKATGEDKALQPRCITRDLKWGTPVPLKGYEDKVFYVWFDAPIGYISITANYTDEWEKWWKNPDQVVYYQFMAKDNVPFHSVIFPATLLGTGKKWTMVNHLMSTEYLNYEDDKFSKSRGIGVFGNDARETGIPSDIWRFYLMYTRPESADSSFRWEDLMLKTNSELLSNVGNFVNRALKFCKENFGGKVHEMALSAEKGDHSLLALVNRYLKSYVDQLEHCRERDAISNILSISRLGNQLMQAEKPWKLVKSANQEDKDRAATVVSFCVNLSCLLALLSEPFMPALSATLLKQLNTTKDKINILRTKGRDEDLVFRCCLPAGHVIGDPFPLIKEIKAEEIQNLKKRFAGRQSQREDSVAPQPAAPAATQPAAKPVAGGSGDAAEVARLEKEVTAQGEVVRNLKASKAPKPDIDAAVAKLLDLKKQLTTVSGVEPTPPATSSNKKKGGKKK